MEEQKKPEEGVNSNKENTSKVEYNQNQSEEPIASTNENTLANQPEKSGEANEESASSKRDTSVSVDVDNDKPLAVVGYIIPILFFIPLMTESKDNQFAKFHASQQLNLLIAWVVVIIVGTLIPILGWFIILPLGSLGFIALSIIGIINVVNGKMKELPIIGRYQLIE